MRLSATAAMRTVALNFWTDKASSFAPEMSRFALDTRPSTASVRSVESTEFSFRWRVARLTMDSSFSRSSGIPSLPPACFWNSSIFPRRSGRSLAGGMSASGT